jgi:hypothetical protein
MDVNDRKMYRISLGELERRWKLVREYLRERGMEALVLQNEKDFTGGYVKWFTDIPAGGGNRAGASRTTLEWAKFTRRRHSHL